jgi:glycerophosphoryl diester phosphodiesterase
MIGSLLMITLGAAGANEAVSPLRPAAELVTQTGLIIAHRGNSSEAPENTLPAFRSAVRAGADLVELDYRHSADGVPVVLHDETLDRTTNAVRKFGREKIRIASIPWADLQGLDAGEWFAESFQGTRLPTLAAAIDVIQQGSVTLIEHKAGDAATCVALLRSKGVVGRVVVQSFDWEFLAECHRLQPELVLGALGKDTLTSQRLDQAVQTGASVLGWNHKHLDQAAVQAARARGLGVWSYTVNDPEQAARLARWGVTGIITDVPVRMAKVRGGKAPATPSAPK